MIKGKPLLLLQGSYQPSQETSTGHLSLAVGNITLHPTLRIMSKCCAWTESGPKNVLRPNRSDLGPGRSSTSACSSVFTNQNTRTLRWWSTSTWRVLCTYLCQGRIVERWPLLLHLFIVGWTIYREFLYQLCDKGVWPCAILNNKHCGKVEVFQFSDLQDVDADDLQKFDGIFIVQRYVIGKIGFMRSC